jgi:hypothetical protein
MRLIYKEGQCGLMRSLANDLIRRTKLTTRELHRAIGVGGYESSGGWRKEGVFFLRMKAPASCYRCPKCDNRDVICRGTFDRTVHAPAIGMDPNAALHRGSTAGMQTVRAGAQRRTAECRSFVPVH